MGSKKIITKFGGIEETAQCLGVRIAVVRYWARTGSIPSDRHEEIMLAAKNVGVDITREDFEGVEKFTFRVQKQFGDAAQKVPAAKRRFLHVRMSDQLKEDIALLESKYPDLTITAIIEMVVGQKADWFKKVP